LSSASGADILGDGGAFKKNLKVIEEDLHRTFGELGHFR
jgi:hypothetical protein